MVFLTLGPIHLKARLLPYNPKGATNQTGMVVENHMENEVSFESHIFMWCLLTRNALTWDVMQKNSKIGPGCSGDATYVE